MVSSVVSIAQRPQNKLKGWTALPCYDIPRLNHIVIDGRDSDWGDDGFRVDLLTPVDGKVRPAADYRAGLRLGWDERGLLLLITIEDKDWCESQKIDELWMRDSLELYLAPYRGALDSCQWVIAPGMTADQSEVRCKFYDNRQSSAKSQPAEEIPIARCKTDKGCRLEVLLPWRSIGVQPRVGREVAFQIMTNDLEAGGTELYHLSWYPALGAAFSSMKMHRLRLAETAGKPLKARLNLLSGQTPGEMTFRVLAPASLAARAVKLLAADQLLTAGTLHLDPSGYAQAILTVPPSPDRQPYDRVNLLLDNEPTDSVVLLPGQDDFPSRALAMEATAAMRKAVPGITLDWPLDEGDTGETTISRCSVEAPMKNICITVTGHSYVDQHVRRGQLYEYALHHEGAALPATGYLYAGSDVPLEEHRGTVVLVVEKSIAAALRDEITRLMQDFVGDGWQVIRHDVARETPVSEVKALLARDYQDVPAVDSVLLLGHVPVPYSGNICPDGHENDHKGAWPADVYYGDLDGQWTDTQALCPDAVGRMKNVAGDGKFDQSTIPAMVKLAVGRVDLSAMPAFGESEETLLRQYLDRDHAYRHKRLSVEPNALINDGFKDRSEGFAYSGWQNCTTLLGSENVFEGDWFQQGQHSYTLMYAFGPGSFTSGGGLGSTEELAARPVHGIFTSIFGSYFADWDTPNNLLRALLCNAGYPLASFWSGRPHWYLHPMGMGKTIGYCARLSQNNDVGGYEPTGEGARGVHIALMGDPTLRLHVVAPPAQLTVARSPKGAQLCWEPSTDQVSGYLVYRAPREFGPYQRLNRTPVTRTSYVDTKGTAGDWYMVRALALQQTPTGSYYNASQGIFVRREP